MATERPVILLSDAIDKLARELMRAQCPFEGVSGDFDRCTSVTRQAYEEEAARAFGLDLDGYYALSDAST